MRLGFVLMVGGALFAREIGAQGAALFPSEDAIRAQLERQRGARKDLFGAVAPGPAVAPSRAPLISTPKPSGIDIGRMAAEYRSKATPVMPPYELAVFVSFSMPEASLRQLADDARRVGGTLVMRGFKDGSLRATQAAIMALGDMPVQINPKAFAQYKVDVVPTFVLARTDANSRLGGDGCALPTTFVSLAGDVGLDYALEYISARDVPYSAYANQLASRLRRAP